jgi:hypothetical protein
VHEPETVPPSEEPDAATATGTGSSSGGATPPPPSEQSASTGGLGPQTDQKGDGAPPGDAPLDLSPSGVDDQPPQSPSGT